MLYAMIIMPLTKRYLANFTTKKMLYSHFISIILIIFCKFLPSKFYLFTFCLNSILQCHIMIISLCYFYKHFFEFKLINFKNIEYFLEQCVCLLNKLHFGLIVLSFQFYFFSFDTHQETFYLSILIQLIFVGLLLYLLFIFFIFSISAQVIYYFIILWFYINFTLHMLTRVTKEVLYFFK